MAFVTDRMIVGGKLEATAGTAETLVAADFDNLAYNLTPIERIVDKVNRKLANAHHGYDKAKIGKKYGTVKFTIDMGYAGTVSTVPVWGPFLEACGWLKTAYTTTGIGYEESSENDCKTMSLQVRNTDCLNTNQKIDYLTGAIGSADLVLDTVGNAVAINFSFSGKMQDQTETGTKILPANSLTYTPNEIIGASITYGSNELTLDSFTYSGGITTNFLSLASDNTGINHYFIASRQSSFSADPELSLSATDTSIADELAGTTRAIVVPIGANMSFTIPEVQVIDDKITDRNGIVVHNLSFGIVDRDGTSGAEILIGAKA